MKRVCLFFLLLCLLILFSCSTIQSPKPWKLEDQDPNITGFLFVKIKPTVNYPCANKLKCRTRWILTGAANSNPKKAINYGDIETSNLIEGKYLLYPLKSDATYLLGYAANIYGSIKPAWSAPYRCYFDIKPGEIAYMGSFNPVEDFKLVKGGTQKQVSYNFTRMDTFDTFEIDNNWLKSRFPTLNKIYRIKNYFPEKVNID